MNKLIVGSWVWVLGLWGGLYATFTGRFYPSYIGETEGGNVRIGGMILFLFCAFGLWLEWKKRNKGSNPKS